MTGRFVLGLVGPPFGLKGFVKVRSLSGETEHLLRLEEVVVRQGGIETLRRIEESARISSGVVMKFAGFGSPEEAKALSGGELVAERSGAAPLREGEFYVEDLRGLEVISPAGDVLGEISDVLEGGGGSLIEVRLPGGGLHLVPFRNEFFAGIDLENRRAELLTEWILE